MDLRELGLRPSFPVASIAFAQLVYASGVSGAGLTETATIKINGVVEQIEIEISTFTDGGQSATVTIASAQDATLFTEGSLGDAQTHLKQALSKGGSTDADFNPALVDGVLTLTGVLSSDPGVSGATIDVTVFYR
ncbi:hypothetical protein LCGC14_0891410 [marine sediment metagenome]|uniref:DUF4402 domain-containing protein n=1 Tax=marine sediment metagenome TaxID=412755 RepID=A0A0F9PJY9_9ZZZZ